MIIQVNWYNAELKTNYLRWFDVYVSVDKKAGVVYVKLGPNSKFAEEYTIKDFKAKVADAKKKLAAIDKRTFTQDATL